jgi:hypothetical protein
MTRSIEAIAQRVPLAPKEKSDTASGHATAIDGLEVTRDKDRLALQDNRLNAAAGDSKTKRLPSQAVPARDGGSSRVPSRREGAANETEEVE